MFNQHHLQHITPTCDQQLRVLFENPTTSRVIEAFSDVPSDLMHIKYGHVGDFELCIGTTLTNIFGKYCLGEVTATNGTNLQSAEQNPLWALCLPNNCTVADFNIVGKMLFQKSKGLTVVFSDTLCQTVEDVEPLLTTGALITITFLVLWVLLTLGATFYDICCVSGRFKFLSAYTNGKRIFKIDNDQIGCLNGLKCLSTIWIVAHHQFLAVVRHSIIANLSDTLNWYNSLRSMFILNGNISVDTFLTIGGTLASYNFMKARFGTKPFHLFSFYIHRYVRLTAPLSVVVLVTGTLSKYVGSGPKWPLFVLQYHKNCEQDGEYLHGSRSSLKNSLQCLIHTWYLDIDTKLNVISPLVLFFLWKHPKLCLPILSLFSMALTAVPFYISWTYSLCALRSNFHCDTNAYRHRYYFATYTRCVPWLVGIILGYFLHKIKRNDIKFRPRHVTVICIWILSLGTALCCIFGGHDSLRSADYNKWGNVLHIAFMRPIWSLVIVWTVEACYTGNAGPLNTVLSLPVFQILHKFTYGIYLTHVVVLYTAVLSTKGPSYFTEHNAVWQLCSTLWVSTGLAVLLVVMVEYPVASIERILSRTKEKNG